MNKKTLKLVCLFAAIIGVALLAVIPNLLSNYMLLVVNNTLIYFIAALGISLMMGMCGQLSFATVGFMGLSAFIAAQLSKTYSVQTMAAGVIAVIVTTIIAYVIGLALLRVSGTYFVFATIAFVNICNSLFTKWKLLCNGADGISSVPALNLGVTEMDSKQKWLYLLVVLAVIFSLIIDRIRRSYLGRAAASVRDNSLAAKTLGVDVYRTKVICFTIAGALGAISGMLLMFQNRYAVQSMFTFEISENFVMMIMLGGVNSTVGALLGCTCLTVLPELLRSFQQYLRLIYGIGIIVLMVFMPMGIMGIVQNEWKKITKRAQTRHVSEEGVHEAAK